MPVYEYVCLDCGSRFDALRPMRAADAPLACDACESEHTSRTLSVFYAQSSRRAVAGTSGSCGCGSCSGGSCATCSSN